MRVLLNLNSTNSCQPLRFAGRGNNKYGNCQPPCEKPCCIPNVDQKYDLACRIIALQKQQIQALTANKTRKS